MWGTANDNATSEFVNHSGDKNQFSSGGDLENDDTSGAQCDVPIEIHNCN